MRHFKNIVVSITVGLFAVVITNQLASVKYPPCDLVARGIGVSTYGCSNTAGSDYPCKNEAASSERMKKCIQANYYQTKTFPFGFKRHFDDSSNVSYKKPQRMNAAATFATTTAISLSVLYLYELKNLKKR